jgi:signal transduction histidine kinase
LKLRAILSYKALFDKKKTPFNIDINKINVIKNIKHPIEEYDLNILKFDNLFAPINIGEKFFGLIETFRETEYTQEDTTCFQTLAKQVSLPLENATLYEEIKKTNKKLERLERLKSEFISIVSHELRTPLTAIKNSLEICLSKEAGEISAITNKFLNMAKKNVIRLSGIINDLLDLSKVEAGKMDFKFEKTNINTPVEFLKNTFENVAKDKNINIILEKDENIALTYIDTQRIEQVMSNLISNAIKFTQDDGEITIKTENINVKDIDKTKLIGAENPTFYSNYVKVSVKDNGIGIAEEDLQKVFNQFQQIENSLNRQNGGTGLGLPIAKQLIEAHKGFIWVESELNKGTTFAFVIPILSEKDKFVIDIDKEIARAKNNSKNILLLTIKEKSNSTNSFLEELKQDKISIIRKTTNTKETYYEEENDSYYIVMMPEADKYAQSFLEKKIESIVINEYETSNKKYDILYSTILYPDGGEDSFELINTMKDSLKKAMEV